MQLAELARALSSDHVLQWTASLSNELALIGELPFSLKPCAPPAQFGRPRALQRRRTAARSPARIQRTGLSGPMRLRPDSLSRCRKASQHCRDWLALLHARECCPEQAHLRSIQCHRSRRRELGLRRWRWRADAGQYSFEVAPAKGSTSNTHMFSKGAPFWNKKSELQTGVHRSAIVETTIHLPSPTCELPSGAQAPFLECRVERPQLIPDRIPGIPYRIRCPRSRQGSIHSASCVDQSPASHQHRVITAR